LLFASRAAVDAHRYDDFSAKPGVDADADADGKIWSAVGVTLSSMDVDKID